MARALTIYRAHSVCLVKTYWQDVEGCDKQSQRWEWLKWAYSQFRVGEPEQIQKAMKEQNAVEIKS